MFRDHSNLLRERLRGATYSFSCVSLLPRGTARLGTALLLGLALLGLSTPAAAQPNTDGLAFTGDALAKVPSHTAIDSISSGLTVEAWVNHNSESNTDAVIVGDTTNLRNGSRFAMHLEGDGEDVYVAFRPTDESSDEVVSNTPLEKA